MTTGLAQLTVTSWRRLNSSPASNSHLTEIYLPLSCKLISFTNLQFQPSSSLYQFQRIVIGAKKRWKSWELIQNFLILESLIRCKSFNGRIDVSGVNSSITYRRFQYLNDLETQTKTFDVDFFFIIIIKPALLVC